MICNYQKYIFITILIITFLLCSQLLLSQNYTLSNWTVEDGLSSNQVSDILQDKEGFIWVATQHGLNKFDGYSFEKFRYNPNDSTSMGANYIENFRLDDEGNIWVNLGVGILSKFNQRTKKFTNYDFEDDYTHIFNFKSIPNIGICIATNKGLYILEESIKKMQKVSLVADEPPLKVYNIFSSINHRYYLSSDAGFHYLNNLSDKLQPTYLVDNRDTTSFIYDVENFYVDNKGKYWIQTIKGVLCQSEDGIYFSKSYDSKKTGTSRTTGQLFVAELKDETAFFSKSLQILTKTNDAGIWKTFPKFNMTVPLSFIDNEKKLWIISNKNELYKWDGKAWEFILTLEGRLEYCEIKEIFVDKKNNIWFGTYNNGLWQIYNRKGPISYVNNHQSNQAIDLNITALSIKSPHFMWIGSAENLYKYHFESEELELFLSTQKQFSHLKINDIDQNEDGEICLATSQGIILIEEDSRNMQHYPNYKISDKEGSLNHTRNIYYDNFGNIWIGTTEGLYLFNKERGFLAIYGNHQSKEHYLRGRDIRSFVAINDTSFLIGYTKYGADLITFNAIDYSISSHEITYQYSRMEQSKYATINTFHIADSEYWAGSFSQGLLKIDLRNAIMKPLSEDFPIIPNICGIQKDDNGILWVSSIDGLRSVHPESLRFYRFSKASGLLSNEFRVNCSTQNTKGNLYFGSKNGLNKVESSKWTIQDTISTPILTDFKKNDKSVVFDSYLDEVETIFLTYQDDYIMFDFVSPTFDNPRDVQYAYRLVGLDEQWRYCEKESSTTYTNLAAGDYTFNVRAGNKGGFFNSKIKEIKLIVAPPFWKTSWFILVMIILFILIFWLSYQLQWQMKMNRLKAFDGIRQKVADDFHDELGHRLTKIGLFVESLILQKENFPDKSVHILQKIQDNANELYYSTKDFIWAIHPSKDSAIDLFVLLRDFGNELFEDTDVQFMVDDFNELDHSFSLNMDLKRQLVLIFKEAMNNSIKHARCSKVVFKMEVHEAQMKLSLIDNGIGFILKREGFGYGLGSMFNRSEKVGGQLKVNTAIDNGTEVLFIWNKQKA